MGRLSSLFSPERIAVVGATERSGSVGRALVENLQADFRGEIIPVNPNYETVCGLHCVDDVSETDADLAVVAVPAAAAVDVVREAGVAGIDDVVVITAGFGETGGEGAGIDFLSESVGRLRHRRPRLGGRERRRVQGRGVAR
jgi:acetyltransferase